VASRDDDKGAPTNNKDDKMSKMSIPTVRGFGCLNSAMSMILSTIISPLLDLLTEIMRYLPSQSQFFGTSSPKFMP
jgi:hypothetical protein